MGEYRTGEVWWTHFLFEEIDEDKHRPAIVLDPPNTGRNAICQ